MKVVTAWEYGSSLFPRATIGTAGLSLVLFTLDVLAIAASGVISGGLYHAWGYGSLGSLSRYAGLGVLAGLLYALPTLYKGESHLPRVLEEADQLRRIVAHWLHAFVFLVLIGFLTKTSADFSRGALTVYFAGGLLCAVAMRKLAAHVVQVARREGYIAGRRVMLVGAEGDIDRALQRICDPDSAMYVCGRFPLSFESPLFQSIDWSDAVDRARAVRADDILILSDRVDRAKVEIIAREFLVLPAAVHVSVGDTLGHFRNARISRLGTAPTICLKDSPLKPMESLAKRSLDLVVASTALVFLSPLLLVIAAAVRFDSPGPALFRQRRRGFNQQEFRIWKFRTMRTIEEGDEVRQAVANDVRVTRVGAWLRRLNLDELPQLINVLRGEMSIVGPRPHAVSHDEHYGERISAYARRLNVKPGLTGWAQIHGFRGPTRTESDMARRVDHDLHYIENWSMLLDLYIIVMTVLSPKAYKNAL